MGVHQKVVRGYLVNEDTKDVLKFQYNPESYYTEHGAKYEEIESPGSKYRTIAYVGRSVEKFPLTLQFYGVTNVASGKSSTQIENYLKALTTPKTKQKNVIKGSNHFISPPICTVVIGSRLWETVVVSVKILRKSFNPKLKTMQIEATIEFIVVERGTVAKTTKAKVAKKKKATKAKNAKKKKTANKKKKSTSKKKTVKKKTTSKKKTSKKKTAKKKTRKRSR